MSLPRRWMVPALIALALVAGLVWAFRPQAVPVDMGQVRRGPLEVTVSDDGETRVREVYLVSAPVPGRVLRLEGDVGDPVRAGETLLARMQPSDPTFLDTRQRSGLEAALAAAEAARKLAAAEVRRIEAESEFASRELERAEALAANRTLSAAELDRARKEARSQEAALMTAKAQLDVRQHEVESARAALLLPTASPRPGNDGECCFDVLAPVSGDILRIFHESEGVVAAGAPLVEIGDANDLEVVVDLLSTDAVRVSQGDPARIERWGGDRPLEARVRRVEPFGFTKVSSLGVEEQRVNVVLDITDPLEEWKRLGHGYRVEPVIVLWREDDVLQVPTSALFRHQGDWAVFAVERGRARIRKVELGERNDRSAQVRAGLEAGDRVILHPSDRVAEGVRVVAREMT